jgi:hypothetical protein
MGSKGKRLLLWSIFGCSLAANFVFTVTFALDRLNRPEDRIGVLTRNVEVGSFSGTETIFRLPRGLTVRDASPRFLEAVDQFEPHRFSIVVTTEDESLINYRSPRESLHQDEEYYSVDLETRREVEREDAGKPHN